MHIVIPAKAGIQDWTPAYAGVTKVVLERLWAADAGMVSRLSKTVGIDGVGTSRKI